MTTPIEALDSAINEVKELGLNCETDLWAVREELERLTAERDTAEANLERLQNKFEQVTGENGRLHAEVTRYRKALWEEYLEAFNDLGYRQARWKSAEEYANALMTDFDRE